MLPHEQVKSLFHQALQVPSAERAGWVVEHCLTAPDLAGELFSLLDAHSEMAEAMPPAPAPEPVVSTATFGAYRAVELIGHGGMSTVYRGRRADGRFEQTVAVKVLAGYLAGPDFLRRFDTERQLLASLNHEHITVLLDGGVSSAGDPYLVTEYVEGKPIDCYCDEQKLDVAARLRLLLQVCEAVDYAHRNLIVHRDLKPGNILVNQEGSVKLLDFGTAALQAAESEVTVTRARMLTPRYASPEQLRGDRVTIASDVFSLGVVAYELASGAWPFGNPDSVISGLNRAMGECSASLPQTVVTAHAAKARSLTEDQLRRTLKGDLSSILLKSLDPDPARRYATVREFADDIRSYLADRPVNARRGVLAYRTLRFVSRNRWRIAAGLVAGAALISACVYGFLEYGREQRRLVQMRELSESYLSDIYQEVSKLPGATKASMLLVDRTRKNLDALLAQGPGNFEMRRALARAYVQLGDIQGEPFAISLGDSTAALASYRKAESLVSSDLQQRGDRGWQALAILVRARAGVAEIEVRAGDYQGAAAILSRTLEPARRLWQEGPKQLDAVQRPPAAVYIRVNLLLGHALMRAADIDRNVDGVRQALFQFRHTVAIAEEERRRNPELPDLAGRYHQYVGYALGLLGDFTGDTRYWVQARGAHERCANTAREEFRKQPSPRTQRDLADGLCEFGWSQRCCGEYGSAIKTLNEALALMEPVAKADPNSLESEMELAAILYRLGTTESAAGHLGPALLHLSRARSMVRLPSQISSIDRERVVRFAEIREQLAGVFMRKRQVPEAVQALSEAVSTVQNGNSVPAWRRAELEAELAHARQSLAQAN